MKNAFWITRIDGCERVIRQVSRKLSKMGSVRNSIRARGNLFMAAFKMLIIGLTAIVTLELTVLDRQAEAIDQKWLTGTRVLGELSDRVSEFRVAETYRALASDRQQRDKAETLATEHRREIESLQRQYLAVLGQPRSPKLEAFHAMMGAYLAAHDEWVRADVDGKLDGPAHYGSSLHAKCICAGAST